MSLREDHWNKVYTTKGERDVSWFQERPSRSLQLIEAHAPGGKASLIDIGGGASRLVDELMARDFPDLTVLDVSVVALDHARARLGADQGRVDWIVADITRWRPARSWDIWHDRAVFHFLTAEPDQEAYLAALAAGTRPGSTVVMATFASDGPERCSGLPVQRYSAEALAARLGGRFALRDQAAEMHPTPWGSAQSFAYAVFARR